MKALLVFLILGAQGIPVQPQQGGTVSGVLKDADGNPISGIRMAAVAKPDSPDDTVDGAVMGSIAETDAEGRYTLENIPPGRYYIAAGRLDLQTYYPGTPEMAAAREIAIGPGASMSGINFTMNDASFGRAGNTGQIPVAMIPIQISVEGGAKLPISGNGKYPVIRLDTVGGRGPSAALTDLSVAVSGIQATDFRVSIENLPEPYIVKSMMYGTTNLAKDPLKIIPANFPPVQGPAGVPSSLSAVFTQLYTLQLSNGTARTGTTAPGAPPARVTRIPPSTLSITLARADSPVPGVRVSGKTGSTQARFVYISDMGGILFSDGSFEFRGVPPGRHSIVTRNNQYLTPEAASVVVGDRDVDGIKLAETPLLPLKPQLGPAGAYPAGSIVPLARMKVNLVDEDTRQPIPEGSVYVKSGPYSFPLSVDPDGHFDVPPLLPGNYEIEIQTFARTTVHQSIDLDDKDVTLEIASKRL